MHMEEKKTFDNEKIGKGPNMLRKEVFGPENQVVVKLSLGYLMCLIGEAYLTFSDKYKVGTFSY